MKKILLRSAMIALTTLTSIVAVNAQAEAPVLQTLPPFIYLADNLDESQKLGWCIDTVGRGFNEKLHSHTCKPTVDKTDAMGSDVRFNFNQETGQIMSLAFDNKCMAFNDPENDSIPFGLIDCTSDVSQKFVHDEAKGQFKLASDKSLCVAVAPTSRSAGPFMSRDLVVANCESTDQKYTTWNIKLK